MPSIKDDYYWDKEKQMLVIEGYGLPPNPEYQNKPIWPVMDLGRKHPKELHRLFFQCYHQALGDYSGKHKEFTADACKLITATCYSSKVCKPGGGLYKKLLHLGPREKWFTPERMPTGLKER